MRAKPGRATDGDAPGDASPRAAAAARAKPVGRRTGLWPYAMQRRYGLVSSSRFMQIA
jgi:hypothetical protein